MLQTHTPLSPRVSPTGPHRVDPRAARRGDLAACIDIGSNTTRLLVGRRRARGMEAVCEDRAFTALGREIRGRGDIGPVKLAEVADVVARQVDLAQAAAGRLRVVATAAMREAANRGELIDTVAQRAGVRVEVLDDEEEARLAFAGAAATLEAPMAGRMAVVDVGGGSTELAVGTAAEGVEWWRSFPLGSGRLADLHLRSDPPSAEELRAAHEEIEGVLEELVVEPPELAVAVGGSASSLARLVGRQLDPTTLQAALRVLASTEVEEVARLCGLEPERARILPGGILVLEAISMRLERPLRIGNGGLREGVVLDLLAEAESDDPGRP